MNRLYLLDSLDGFKGLVFRLLPAHIAGSIACVPMTTDGPWSDAEKRAFEAAVGIPGELKYWAPGGFDNVPPHQILALGQNGCTLLPRSRNHTFSLIPTRGSTTATLVGQRKWCSSVN